MESMKPKYLEELEEKTRQLEKDIRSSLILLTDKYKQETGIKNFCVNVSALEVHVGAIGKETFIDYVEVDPNSMNKQIQKYRVWPDYTVQEAEEEVPYSWTADDYVLVAACNEEQAVEIYRQIELNGWCY